MRYVFVGSVESSLHALEAMFAQNADVVGVFTLALEHAHRHSDFADLRPLTQNHHVPLWGIDDINDPEVVGLLKDLAPDYIFVIGWSQIVKPVVLEILTKGCIGFHPALLPQNRGRAVLPWTLLQGLDRSGATLFYLDEGVDSGDILIQKSFSVEPKETARTLYEKVVKLLSKMIQSVLPLLEAGNPPRQPQDDSKATYCAKRTPKDGLINWEWSAERVWTLIRAVGEPYPGAFTFYQGKKVIIWDASLVDSAPYYGLEGQIQNIDRQGVLVQCGDGKHIQLRTVQPEGQKPCPAQEYFTRIHEVLGIDWLKVYEHFHQMREENAG